MTNVVQTIMWILAFVPAIVLHEMGHAIAAYKLGDPTAARKGRISFNPIRHIDPFGTILLPLLLVLANMPVFGYARPVPYNPRYFKDPKKGELIVGLAGPAANLVQALAGALIAFIVYLVTPASAWYTVSAVNYVMTFLYMYVQVNLYLLFFNIIPIPPLDGSSIFAFILPRKYLNSYYKIQQWARPVLMIVLILLPRIIGFSPFSIYLNATAGNLSSLLFSFLG